MFQRSGDAWTEVRKLVDNDAAEHDFFGASVAVDVDQALIGAPWDDDGGSASGAVNASEV